jgi:hypothetical protein
LDHAARKLSARRLDNRVIRVGGIDLKGHDLHCAGSGRASCPAFYPGGKAAAVTATPESSAPAGKRASRGTGAADLRRQAISKALASPVVAQSDTEHAPSGAEALRLLSH